MKCLNCNHGLPYHIVGDEVGKCWAWNPDKADFKCGCDKFVAKVKEGPKEHKPWGHERKDLQD